MSDPVAFIVRLSEIAGEFEFLLRGIVFVIGLLLIIQALRLAARRAEHGTNTVSAVKILAGFAVGTALLAFPQTVVTLVGTLFGPGRPDDASSIFAYGEWLEPISGSRQAIEAVVRLIQLFGFIAVARGLLFLNFAASPGGPKSLGPGITFIIAGTLAVNFPAFFGMMTKLFTAP